MTKIFRKIKKKFQNLKKIIFKIFFSKILKFPDSPFSSYFQLLKNNPKSTPIGKLWKKILHSKGLASTILFHWKYICLFFVGAIHNWKLIKKWIKTENILGLFFSYLKHKLCYITHLTNTFVWFRSFFLLKFQLQMIEKMFL